MFEFHIITSVHLHRYACNWCRRARELKIHFVFYICVSALGTLFSCSTSCAYWKCRLRLSFVILSYVCTTRHCTGKCL